MSRYRFELATVADDAELRAILAETPMPGTISVAFRREPSFFGAASVEGPFHQVVVCRDVDAGRIVGFGSRSIRMRYVNGAPEPVGYLSSLRVLPPYRSLGLVARGYQFFRRLHDDGRIRLYLTTIAEGNEAAISILTSGRAGLPHYQDAGRYYTLVAPRTSAWARPSAARGVEARAARLDDLPEMLAFLAKHGPSRQFFPAYEAGDFTGERPTFRGLSLGEIALATRGGSVVGMLAAWDQCAFKQTVVNGYGWKMRGLRPLYNAAARWRGAPALPKPGEAFPFITAALPLVVEENDEEAALALLRRHAADAAKGRFLLLGLHERDPLLPVFQHRSVTRYVTRLYHVCFEDGEEFRAKLDARPPYLELGCL